MTSTGKQSKYDLHAKVKRIIISPDLSKLERVIVDSKTIKFVKLKVKPTKKKR